MAINLLDERRMRLRIAALTRKYRSQKVAAKKWGISEAYLCDILQGRRAPGAKILAAIGYQRVTSYTKQEEPPHADAG